MSSKPRATPSNPELAALSLNQTPPLPSHVAIYHGVTTYQPINGLQSNTGTTLSNTNVFTSDNLNLAPSAVNVTAPPSAAKKSRRRSYGRSPRKTKKRKISPLPIGMKKIPILPFNVTPAELEEFLRALLEECKIFYPEFFRHVNFGLIQTWIDAICNHIWIHGDTQIKYLTEDKGRFTLLILWISSSIGDDVVLTLEEFDTIVFVMACIRKHSTKGNSSFEKVQHVTELTAQIVHERMHKVCDNIDKLYSVSPKSDRKNLAKDALVTISDKQTTPGVEVVSFAKLLDNNEFDTFMKTKKAKQHKKDKNNSEEKSTTNELGTTQAGNDTVQAENGQRNSTNVLAPALARAQVPAVEPQPDIVSSSESIKPWLRYMNDIAVSDPARFDQFLAPRLKEIVLLSKAHATQPMVSDQQGADSSKHDVDRPTSDGVAHCADVIMGDIEPVDADIEREKNNEEGRDEMLTSLNELNGAGEGENCEVQPIATTPQHDEPQQQQNEQQGATEDTNAALVGQFTEAMDSFPDFVWEEQQPAEDTLTEHGWTNAFVLESQR